MHLSRELSGTWDAARLAAEEVGPERVHVVDSRATGMGLGFAVLAAADAARGRSRRGRGRGRRGGGGGALPDVLLGRDPRPAAPRWAHRRRGRPARHRAGGQAAAARGAGPDRAAGEGPHHGPGRPAPGRARGAGGRDGPVDLAVHHLAAAARAEEVAARLRERLQVARLLVSEVGAVIGAHVGPGLLGVVVVRLRPPDSRRDSPGRRRAARCRAVCTGPSHGPESPSSRRPTVPAYAAGRRYPLGGSAIHSSATRPSPPACPRPNVQPW